MDRCPHCGSKKGFTYKTEVTLVHDVPSWDPLREIVVDLVTTKWPRVVTCKSCKRPIAAPKATIDPTT
jgi:hypothetical protein